MANSLLDFVISLVRDPDAAARYAANPAQSIADAHLTDVTSADVNNLIPMVTDSLSMGTPATPTSGALAPDHGNVWASGAAAAALDAFTPHTPAGVVDSHGLAGSVIHQPSIPAPVQPSTDPRPLGIDSPGASVQLTGVETPDTPVDHGGFPAHDLSLWDHPVTHSHPGEPEHHDFGLHG
ncbi:Rv0340 family IniB-related protein [Mycobacterium sp. Aquia_213]|uniref:Rv0340 family IniB-related protein n=1 Tax=Mycobacterium sp. Aquia_213 TaxID=2991728 RepID=UPI0022710CEC|nr:Rv0340 family IniB-related protein [Mycobacterium sp. Aquia_213]WAC94536.1 Rv0340 family protein [Mycobacterium sp. Aquia_213]